MSCGESSDNILCSKKFHLYFSSQKVAEKVDVSGVSPDETADFFSECEQTISLNISN